MGDWGRSWASPSGARLLAWLCVLGSSSPCPHQAPPKSVASGFSSEQGLALLDGGETLGCPSRLAAVL